MATFRKRKTSSGEVRWAWRLVVKGRAAYGTAPTLAAARDCAKQAEVELLAGRLPGSGGITLAQVLERYRTEYLPRIPDSASLYGYHLGVWSDLLGSRPAASITAQDVAAAHAKIRGFRSQLGKARKAGAVERPPIGAATANRFLTTLSSVFSWASSLAVGLVAGNPVRQVPRAKEVKRRRWLTRVVDQQAGGDGSELVRLLRACRDSKSGILFDLVVLLLATGCRLDEVLSLRRRDVRLSDGGFTLRPEDTKTDEPRFVVLLGPALEVVRRRLEAPAKGSLYLFPCVGKKRPPADPPRKERPYAYPPRHAWAAALQQAGVADFRLHDLRHTAASWARMAGRSIPELQAITGHASVESVMRYAHLRPEHGVVVSADVQAQLEAGLAQLAAESPQVERTN